VSTGRIETGFQKQSLTTKRCTRSQSGGIANGQFSDIHRVESIHVFDRAESSHNRGLIDLRWRWRLDKNAVNLLIRVQLFDDSKQLLLGGGGRQFDLSRVEAQFLRCPVLVSDVSDRCRVIADQDNRKTRYDSQAF
jgi:hypothetical protein